MFDSIAEKRVGYTHNHSYSLCAVALKLSEMKEGRSEFRLQLIGEWYED